LEQLSDPLAVADIGLATGHLLDVLSVDQEEFKDPFHEVPDGFPVDASGLHGDMGDTFVGQPVDQLQQRRGVGGKGANSLGEFVGAKVEFANTDGKELLVNVKTGTAGMDEIHDETLRTSAATATTKASSRQGRRDSRGKPREQNNLLCVL
jgi:hypothetical protein